MGARADGFYWARITDMAGKPETDWTVIQWHGDHASILGYEGSLKLGDIAEWGSRIEPPDGSALPVEWAEVVGALREVEAAARKVARPRGERRTRLEVALDALEAAEGRRVRSALDRLERQRPSAPS